LAQAEATDSGRLSASRGVRPNFPLLSASLGLTPLPFRAFMEAMFADGASALAVDHLAASLEAKPGHPWQRSMSRHSTATSLLESHFGALAKEFDGDSECGLPGDEEFQDRPRLQDVLDYEDMAYRPDIYADAFEASDADLLLYDWGTEELPEQDDAELQFDYLEIDENDEVQSEVGMPVGASSSSGMEGVTPLPVAPKAPPSTAPRGFARKHQHVLVVSPAPGVEVSEPSAPQHEHAKVPQGSALAAIAALRPGTKNGHPDDAAAGARPVTPAAPAERPLKRRPCNSVALRLLGGVATAPVASSPR